MLPWARWRLQLHSLSISLCMSSTTTLSGSSGTSLPFIESQPSSVKTEAEEWRHRNHRKKLSQQRRNQAVNGCSENRVATHFVAIRVDNPDIVSEILVVQDELLKKSNNAPHVRDAIRAAPARKAHLTLVALALTSDTLPIAVHSIHNCAGLAHQLGLRAARARFSGLHSFPGNRVLFCSPQPAPGFEQYLNSVRTTVTSALPPNAVMNNSQELVLHTTIAKVRGGKKRIPPSIWASLALHEFGEQDFTELQLLAMAGEPGGYYKCECTIPIQIPLQEELQLGIPEEIPRPVFMRLLRFLQQAICKLVFLPRSICSLIDGYVVRPSYQHSVNCWHKLMADRVHVVPL